MNGKFSILGDLPSCFEDLYALNAKYAYEYAKIILKGEFEKGEDAIATDAEYSYLYAINIIKGRFIKGEDAIATEAVFLYRYATDVVKGRFIKGEKVILNSEFKNEYKNFLKGIGIEI